jgi:hypothetical protein
MRTVLFLSIVSGLAAALPAAQYPIEKHDNDGPDPSLATTVSFQGSKFINKVRVLRFYVCTTRAAS